MGKWLLSVIVWGVLGPSASAQPPGELAPRPPGTLSPADLGELEAQIARMVDAAVARAIDRISPAGGTDFRPPAPPWGPSPSPYPAPQSQPPVYASPQSVAYATAPPSRVRVQIPPGPILRTFDALGASLRKLAQPRIREYSLAPWPVVESTPPPPVWASPQR